MLICVFTFFQLGILVNVKTLHDFLGNNTGSLLSFDYCTAENHSIGCVLLATPNLESLRMAK